MKCFFFLVLIAFITQGESSRERRGIGEIEPSDTLNITLSGDNYIDLECDFNNTEIWITSVFLDSLNIDVIDKLDFLDADGNPIAGCSFTYNNSDIHLRFNSLGECAASVEVYGDVLTVNYKICVVPFFGPNQYISRDVSVTFWVSCEFNSTINADSLAIIPLIDKVEIEGEVMEGRIQVSMRRYTDETCSMLDESGDVEVPDPVFVGLALDEGENTGLILQVRKCWAQPSDDPDESIRYDIINPEGCRAMDPDGDNVIYENYENITAKFSFLSFVWTGIPMDGQEIFIYCKVTFCSTLAPDGSACTEQPNCSGRKRRSSRSLKPNEKIVSLKPLTLRIRQCDKFKLGCSHDCATTNYGIEICVCPEDFTLQHDLRTCKKDQNQAPVIVETIPDYRDSFNIFNYTILFLSGILVMFSFLIICVRKNREQQDMPKFINL